VQRLLLTRFTAGLHQYEQMVAQEAAARGIADLFQEGSWVAEKD
jgi:hypothetical protein